MIQIDGSIISPLMVYLRLKIEKAYDEAMSKIPMVYSNEYIDEVAMEIFMRMVHDDPVLQNCMQPIVDAWYKGVVEEGKLNELYNAGVERPIIIDNAVIENPNIDELYNGVVEAPIINEGYNGGVEESTTKKWYTSIVENPVFIDTRKKVETGVGYANLGVGAFSTYLVYAGGQYKWNEIWHKTKTAGTAFCWESRWRKNFSVQHRIKDVSGVNKYRDLGKKVGRKASIVLLGADILASGEVTPSDFINLAATLASKSGIGAVVAAVWFAADYGTMGINLLISGEAKGLGDIIDENLSDYCFKLPF